MNQNPAGNRGKIIARRQQLSGDEMGANCEESAGGRENGYDWMLCWERERFGFVTNNSIEVCNNVRARDMNTVAAVSKGSSQHRSSPFSTPETSHS